MMLKEKVYNLPSSPGVYLMKDSQGMIIYVGKAKNLKNRVRSYFRDSQAHTEKVKKLIKNLKDFDYILTDTEFEAFMLECKLIKKIKPLYNKKMKRPLSYTFIVVKPDKDGQRIEITQNPNENGSYLNFGPFTSKSTVERAIQGIKECFKINCSNSKKRNTACLNYSLGLCNGLCKGGAALVYYHHIIDKFIELLNGTDIWLLEEMKQKMHCAANEYDFETAAKYRNYIESLSFLISKEKVIEFTKENKNLAIIESLNDQAFKLFLIKGNKVLFCEKYLRDEVNIAQQCAIIKTNIVTYFTDDSLTSSVNIGKNEIDEAQIIYSYLKGNNSSYITIPPKWLTAKHAPQLNNAVKKLLLC
ncbi:MAG TPA: GIY-YIG nuclease family protein [Neobacillus sp.]|jgi:excinuclease ABC subunit C